MKRGLTIALAFLLIVMLVGCGARGGTTPTTGTGTETGTTNNTESAGGETFKIRLGHATTDTHPYTLGAIRFKEIVEEKTGGKVQVEIFPNATLGGERDMLEGLQLGTIEMVLVSTAPLAGYTDAFLPFDLPYLFETKEAARAVCDSEIGREMLDSIEAKGMKGIVFFENGMRQFTNSKHPISTPADVNGLKIRVMENEIMMATITAYGGDPTPMAFNELYTGLQQKTIDGQENPIAQIHTMKFYEAQEFMSMTNHFYAPAPMIMAKPFWDKLPAEYQEIIMKAAEEGRDLMRQKLDEQDAEQLKEMKDFGLNVTEQIDLDAFKQASQAVYDQYVGDGKKIPTELVDKIRKFNQ